MKKTIILMIANMFLFTSLSFASEADRQVSKYTAITTNGVQVTSVASEVFGITAIATAANGWVAVYDTTTPSSITASTEPKIEIREATSGNTGIKDWLEGLDFYTGIYAEGSDVKTVIYYR